LSGLFLEERGTLAAVNLEAWPSLGNRDRARPAIPAAGPRGGLSQFEQTAPPGL